MYTHKTPKLASVVRCLVFLLVAAGPTFAAAATHTANLVSPEFPLPSSCFGEPHFSPAFPGVTLQRNFAYGNWHYDIHYRYDYQKSIGRLRPSAPRGYIQAT